MIWRPFCRRHFGIFLINNWDTLIITEIWLTIRMHSVTIQYWHCGTTEEGNYSYPLLNMATADQTEQVTFRYAVFPWMKCVHIVWLILVPEGCSQGCFSVSTGLLVSVHRVACQCSQGCLSVFTGLLVSVHRVACQCSQGCLSAFTGLLVSVHRVACQWSQGCLSVFTGLLVSGHRVACQWSQGWRITSLLRNIMS